AGPEKSIVSVVFYAPNRPIASCNVIATYDGDSTFVARDLAIIKCQNAVALFPTSLTFDVLGRPEQLKPRAPLMLIGNLVKGRWFVPPGYFIFDQLLQGPQIDAPTIDFFNPMLFDLEGASGGPLLTDRSELIGITVRAGDKSADSYAKAIP